MSPSFRWLLPILITALFPACDTSDPEDAAQLLITDIEIRLQDRAESRHTVATVHGATGLMPGDLFEADTLVMEPGAQYSGSIQLFYQSGKDATSEIRLRAENYQLFYTVEPSEGIDLAITDLESNYGSNAFGADLEVGLAFDVTVAEGVLVEDGTIRVRVGDFGPGVKNGYTLTVAPVVDVMVPFRVAVPPPPPPDPAAPEGITRATLTLARQDGTATWTALAVAVDDSGLVDENEAVPDSLAITGCTTDNSGTQQCTTSAYLHITEGVYEGSWELEDEETGASFTAEITTEGDRHQFYYWYNFGASHFTIKDLDTNGLPLGMLFEIAVPGNVRGTGSMKVRLTHFTNAPGDIKSGTNAGNQDDLRFRIPMTVN